jgi:hypothetical protein
VVAGGGCAIWGKGFESKWVRGLVQEAHGTGGK